MLDTTVRYGEITDRDEELSLSLIRQIVPEDLLEEFLKIISSEDDVSEALKSHEVGFFYACAVSFTEMKRWSEKILIVKSMISRIARLINYRDSIHLFVNASEDIQKHVYAMINTAGKPTVNAYLSSAVRIGVKSMRYVANDDLILGGRHVASNPHWTQRRFTDWFKAAFRITYLEYKNYSLNCADEIFDSIIKEKTGSSNEDDLFLLKLRSPYKQMMVSRNPTLAAFEDMRIPILVMWKIIYGEKKVIDCMKVFEEEDSYLNPDDLMVILDDWDDLKSYPNEWIISVVNVKG